jgi:chemotaxis protein MotB
MNENLLAAAQVKDDLDRLRRELTQTLSSQIANHSISLEMGRDGLVISLREAGFFDNVPIHNAEFDSNWELSLARTTRIARIFLEMNAIPPNHLSAAGYAEFHPVASNSTPEGRAENRRVDLVVLSRARINFAAQSPAQATGAWREITEDE